MQKINQIPISEFASLTNVSRQTLIYYDKINLFKPDYKNEIGYRYYSIKQIELISVITLLKELGILYPRPIYFSQKRKSGTSRVPLTFYLEF